jgi:aminoglycoside phosphotransferase (APT) family kinase protein
MHADELDIDEPLVRRLLAAQFPEWAELPLEAVPWSGTDNAIFRLGDEMAVRLPRIHWATGQVEKERRWLPGLAPLLPLALPTPLAKGEPAEGYPWHWSVNRWLAGETATIERFADPRRAATDLARFLLALQRIDPADGPAPGASTFARGVPLALRDDATRDAIASLRGKIDTEAVTAEWDRALAATPWDGPAVWIHGDFAAGNLIVEDGVLSGVIDWGGLTRGDPATDLIVAWNLLDAETRDVFRAELGVDDATWARGRGWAVSIAMIALPYYEHTNPVIIASSRRVLAELAADGR